MTADRPGQLLVEIAQGLLEHLTMPGILCRGKLLNNVFPSKQKPLLAAKLRSFFGSK